MSGTPPCHRTTHAVHLNQAIVSLILLIFAQRAARHPPGVEMILLLGAAPRISWR